VVTVPELKSLRPGAARIGQLEQRVAELEADLTQLRRHQLRLAELVDVVQELLVPVASRDEAAIQQAIERFQESL
jgi:hypothetical protein